MFLHFLVVVVALLLSLFFLLPSSSFFFFLFFIFFLYLFFLMFVFLLVPYFPRDLTVSITDFSAVNLPNDCHINASVITRGIVVALAIAVIAVQLFSGRRRRPGRGHVVVGPAAGTRPRPLRTSGRSNRRHRRRRARRVPARPPVATDAQSLPGRRDVRRLPALAGRDLRPLAAVRRGPRAARLRHRSRDRVRPMDERVPVGRRRVVIVLVSVAADHDESERGCSAECRR